jgi:hypothetical protein
MELVIKPNVIRNQWTLNLYYFLNLNESRISGICPLLPTSSTAVSSGAKEVASMIKVAPVV